jgi:hypothetical protein
MKYNDFKTEVTAGLVSKYDQQSLFSTPNTFSFNEYYKTNSSQVITIIKVYYNSVKSREDIQEYLVTECQTAIIEKATNNQ